MITDWLKKDLAGSVIFTATFLCIAYAILRYNIAGEVLWKEIPIFIFNKGISLASFIFITLSISLGPLRNCGLNISNRFLETRKSLGTVGMFYAFAHFALSISILNPVYFPVFYGTDGALLLRGELCLLGGILGFTILLGYYHCLKENEKRIGDKLRRVPSKKIIVAFFFVLGLHLLYLGYSGWTTTTEWPAGLPPISLLSFIICFTGFMVNLIGRN